MRLSRHRPRRGRPDGLDCAGVHATVSGAVVGEWIGGLSIGVPHQGRTSQASREHWLKRSIGACEGLAAYAPRVGLGERS